MTSAARRIQYENKKRIKIRSIKTNIRLEQTKKSNAVLAKYIFLALAVIALSSSLLYRYTVITKLSRYRQELVTKIDDSIAKRDYLISKLEPFKSTSRIENLAKSELSMQYPVSSQKVKVNTNYDFSLAKQNKRNSNNIFRNFFAAMFGKGQ